MRQTIIKNIATGITKKCDVLYKNESFLEVVIVDTTIKITLKKKSNIFKVFAEAAVKSIGIAG